MNIKRAGKQQQACFRSERRYKKQWNADYHWSDVDKLIQGHAAGWIAGVAWAKRNPKKKIGYYRRMGECLEKRWLKEMRRLGKTGGQ